MRNLTKVQLEVNKKQFLRFKSYLVEHVGLRPVVKRLEGEEWIHTSFRYRNNRLCMDYSMDVQLGTNGKQVFYIGIRAR